MAEETPSTADQSEIVILPVEQQRSPRSLAKALQKGDVPDAALRALPAQSLFLAINETGIAGSVDCIMAATDEQVRLLLDFDTWSKDCFNEEAFWEWLELSNDDEGLKILQKILRSLDLKLVALLINKYIEVEAREEPTDNPPGEGFNTPDKGYTWVKITHEDETRSFHLNRLLALIFETSADLFYQLLATKTISTASQLEEEAFQEKLKRLRAEGIPDEEFANHLFTLGSFEDVKTAFLERRVVSLSLTVAAAPAFLYDDYKLEPLSSALSHAADPDVLLQEYTLLLNAGIVRWFIDFSDTAAVKLTAEKVKGAINLALQRATKKLDASPEEILNTCGLTPLLRYGMSILNELRTVARKSRAVVQDKQVEPWQEALLTFTTHPFPSAPIIALSSAVGNEPELNQSEGAIQNLAEYEAVKTWLTKIA